MVLETYNSSAIVEIVGNISVSLFGYNLRTAEVVISGNTIYGLTGSSTLVVIGEGESFSALRSSDELSAFPCEGDAVIVGRRITYTIISYASSIIGGKKISPNVAVGVVIYRS